MSSILPDARRLDGEPERLGQPLSVDRADVTDWGRFDVEVFAPWRKETRMHLMVFDEVLSPAGDGITFYLSPTHIHITGKHMHDRWGMGVRENGLVATSSRWLSGKAPRAQAKFVLHRGLFIELLNKIEEKRSERIGLSFGASQGANGALGFEFYNAGNLGDERLLRSTSSTPPSLRPMMFGWDAQPCGGRLRDIEQRLPSEGGADSRRPEYRTLSRLVLRGVALQSLVQTQAALVPWSPPPVFHNDNVTRLAFDSGVFTAQVFSPASLSWTTFSAAIPESPRPAPPLQILHSPFFLLMLENMAARAPREGVEIGAARRGQVQCTNLFCRLTDNVSFFYDERHFSGTIRAPAEGGEI